MTAHLTQTAPTIAAPATAAGSALGIIRISGSQAIQVAERMFRGRQLALQASHTAHFGRIVDEGDPLRPEIIDEVVVTLFRGPHSFTGEDVVEISCHGSSYIMQRILEVSMNAGAVPAKEGEFTQRAFLNGKMDLTQAEAVADLIAAQSKAAQQSAMHQLRGGFSGDLKRMREELITFSALIELELDFSQEDVEFADRAQLYQLLDRINVSTVQLIRSFRLGNAVKNGVSVAIIGAPNAGKSTLLNALLNEDRAIVSEIAGTTRDTIEETINIEGILFRFIDTAGIREHTDDVIERKGIDRSLSNAATADVVIHLLDMSVNNEKGAAWLAPFADRTITVYNKMDLWQKRNERGGVIADPGPGIFISAKNGAEIDALKGALLQKVASDKMAPGQTIITNARHLAALQQINSAVAEIKAGMDSNISGELIALDIRRALDYIGELTGTVYHDKDVLGAIFGKFCIGK